MIRLKSLTKIFSGQATPAVDQLSLEVPAGQTCVLIGPSGCGKTTTLKMINRLVEPTGGRIVVGGEDVTGMDPVALRRRMGYVIQQIGLFPHMTIAENIATVPRLVGWPAARIAARVDEMLTLVGMDPAIHRTRYPRELSGGQRQRVGVARALAGDPPVMLMDEPFGAIDPITRGRLQNEFLKILKAIRKTVVFVTHDVDEAIKMGDRIAILRDGRLVQYGTPDEILARPANAFVEEFVGTDRALKRLALVTVREAMRTDTHAAPLRPCASIPEDATVKEALSAMLALNGESLRVVDQEGRLLGLVTLRQIQELVAGRSKPAQSGDS